MPILSQEPPQGCSRARDSLDFFLFPLYTHAHILPYSDFAAKAFPVTVSAKVAAGPLATISCLVCKINVDIRLPLVSCDAPPGVYRLFFEQLKAALSSHVYERGLYMVQDKVKIGLYLTDLYYVITIVRIPLILLIWLGYSRDDKLLDYWYVTVNRFENPRSSFLRRLVATNFAFCIAFHFLPLVSD